MLKYYPLSHSDLKNSNFLTRSTATLILTTLAIAGNMISLPLFYGVDFIFGSVAVMMALQLLGILPAVLVAFAGGLYTLILWGHPYALIIFTVEALVAGILCRHGFRHLIMAVVTYWLILGIPLVLLLYRGIGDLPWNITILIALKQPINGLINALIAVLLLIGVKMLRQGKSWQYMNPVQVTELLFNAILAVILLAGTIPIIYQGYQYRELHETFLAKRLTKQADDVIAIINHAGTNPEQWQELLTNLTLDTETSLTLTASDTIIASYGQPSGISLDYGKVHPVTQELIHWSPNSTQPAITRWKEGIYGVTKAISHPVLDSVTIEYPAKALILQIEKNTTKLFLLLAVLFGAGILIARQLSNLLITPLTRLARVANDTTNGIIITDKDGLVEWVNDGFTRMTGYGLKELAGQKPGTILQGPDTNSDSVATISAALKNKDTFDVEIANYKKNGQLYWVHIVGNPLFDDLNNLKGFMAVQSDITEVKLASLQLKHFKTTLDQTLDCVFMFGADNLIFTYANAGALNQIGYTKKELMTMHPYDIKPEMDSRQFKFMIKPLLEGKQKTINFQTIHQHKSGSRIPVDIFLQYIRPDTGSSHFVAIVRDISERLKAQAELTSEVERTRAILENMVDGIITIDEKGTIQTCNQAAENIFGYSAEMMRGQNVKILMPNPYRDAHDNYLKNYKETRQANIINKGREVEGLRRDGNKFPMELGVSEIIYQGQTLYVGIVRDITERRELDKMKSEFISTVSHELRTPLTSIRGALTLVLAKIGDSIEGKPKRMLEMAERNSKRLTFLINDILDLEKIESGRMEFEFQSVDLITLTQRSIEDNEGYATDHKVHLLFDSPLKSAPILADEHRLLQVLANLISNAVKFSVEGESVEVSVTTHHTNYRLTVTDHGKGIPEEFKDRIFQRFAQADASDVREKSGTGLGLSISKAIVERHHGRIDYESNLGQGTSLYVDLPAESNFMEQDRNNQGGSQVLICEDNKDAAEILADILANEGISCDIALNLAEARLLLVENNYQLMLLDLLLPDGDGMLFIDELRNQSSTRTMPIIVVSGYVDHERFATRSNMINVVDWLPKPIDQTRLSRAIKEMIPSSVRPHILHVEDDIDIVNLVQNLTSDFADFSHVSGLDQARQLLNEQQYDLVLLDLGLADGSGSDLLDQIQQGCPVVIFSASMPTSELTKQVSYALTKSTTSNDELLDKIKFLLKGFGNE